MRYDLVKVDFFTSWFLLSYEGGTREEIYDGGLSLPYFAPPYSILGKPDTPPGIKFIDLFLHITALIEPLLIQFHNWWRFKENILFFRRGRN